MAIAWPRFTLAALCRYHSRTADPGGALPDLLQAARGRYQHRRAWHVTTNVGRFEAAAIGLSAFGAAQVGEVVRGALSSMPKGQIDAGQSLGLTFWQRGFSMSASAVDASHHSALDQYRRRAGERHVARIAAEHERAPVRDPQDRRAHGRCDALLHRGGGDLLSSFASRSPASARGSVAQRYRFGVAR